MKAVFLTLCLLLASLAPSARAQDETAVDEVLVEVRRSGAPTWEVSDGRSTVLLVGAVRGLPRSLEWRPDALERAAQRADRVLYSQDVNISPWDIMRLIWRSRDLTRLPRDRTSADYLSPEWSARLNAVGARERRDFSRQSFFSTSSDLMFDLTGLNRDRGRAVEDVVRRTARRGRTPSERVGRLRGDELIDDLLALPPEAWVPCLERAIPAGEAGEAGMLARAEAWRRFDVPAVMASPLEQALSVCWPWGDPDYGPQLRGQWQAAVDRALGQEGVTLAVVPLRVLAEPEGLLDRLQARGYEVLGPRWRAEN